MPTIVHSVVVSPAQLPPDRQSNHTAIAIEDGFSSAAAGGALEDLELYEGW